MGANDKSRKRSTSLMSELPSEARNNLIVIKAELQAQFNVVLDH